MTSTIKIASYTPAAKLQFAKNADSLLKMAEKAWATGKRVNGYSEAELRAMEVTTRLRANST